jgi:hypothetical protein
VVAVSAIDGSYRRLNLPGYDEMRSRVLNVVPTIAVSPDGRTLAYPWHAKLPSTSGPHVPRGIRTVDLISGSIRTYPVSGGLAALCAGLAFSPNAKYLVASCDLQESLDVGGSRAETGETVRLDLRAHREIVVPVGRWTSTLAAVNDRGEVAVFDGGAVEVWTLQGEPRVHRRPVAIDSSDESVGWMGKTSSVVVFASRFRSGRPDGVGVHVVPVRGGSGRVSHLDGIDGWMLGSVGADQAALWVFRSRGGDVYLQSESGDPVRKVHFAGLPPLEALSVATTLLEQPTRDTPDPNAFSSWDRLRQALPYVSVGLLLILAVMLGVVGRRKQRLRQV